MAYIDSHKIIDQNLHVENVVETFEGFEITIDRFPHNPLRIKIEETGNADFPYRGKTNYKIKNPTQFDFYRSWNLQENQQGAIEEALHGFLTYYDPNIVEEIEFQLDEDW